MFILVSTTKVISENNIFYSDHQTFFVICLCQKMYIYVIAQKGHSSIKGNNAWGNWRESWIYLKCGLLYFTSYQHRWLIVWCNMPAVDISSRSNTDNEEKNCFTNSLYNCQNLNFTYTLGHFEWKCIKLIKVNEN